MKIKFKLTFLLLITSVLLVTTVSFVYFIQVKKEYLYEINAHLESVAEAKSVRILNISIKREEVAALLASNEVLIKRLRGNSSKENIEELNIIFQRYLSIIEPFNQIQILSPEGKVVISTNEASIDKDFSNYNGFISAKQGRTLMNGIHYDGKGILSFYLSAPINFHNELIGVVLIEMDASEVVNLTSDYTGLGQTGESVLCKIIDGKTVLITPARFNKTGALNMIFDSNDLSRPMNRALTGYNGIMEGIDYRGEEVVASTRYIPHSHWGLVVKMDKTEAYAPINRLKLILLFINLLAVLLGLIGAFVTGTVIARPIQKLRASVNKFEEGNLSERVKIDSQDELGMLAASFNNMADKLQKKIVSSENLFAQVFDSVEKGILLFKPLRNESNTIYDFEYLLVNQAAEQILNRKREDLIGKKWLVEYPNMKEIGTFTEQVECIETGITKRFEFFYGFQGFNRWYRNKFIKTKNNELLVTFEDITEQKLSRIKLEESQRLLLQAEELAKMGNYEIIIGEKSIKWSDNLYRMYGYEPNEIQVTFDNFLNYVHPEDRDAILKLNREKFQHQIPFEFNYRIIRKDGEVRFIYGRNRIIEVDHKKKLVGFVQDITDRVVIENKLKQSERFLLESQEIALVGSFENDLIENKITGTPQYYKIIGFSPDEKFTYLDILERIHEDDRDRVAKIYLDAVKAKADYNVVYKFVMADNSIKYIWGRAKLMVDEKGNAEKFIGTTADITRIKIIEEELLKSKKDLESLNQHLEKRVSERTNELERVNEQLNKINEQLDKYAYVISHDLRAPLNAIEGLAIFLEDEYKEKPMDQEGSEMIHMIKGKISDMKALIEEVLKLAKEEKKGKEVISLFDLVNEVIDTLNPPSNFHIFLSHTLPVINYHKVSMTQILQNLIGNAIKYMDKEHPLIKISSSELDKYFKICVEDNGQGIPERKLACIFNPFEIAHQNENLDSHGIGLSIVKQLVEENGGQVWVESEEGVGSRFHFTIPK